MRMTVEKAREILLTKDDPLDREYYEAVINNTLSQYYAGRLYISSLCSNDLPEELVGPWHPDYPFVKCRGNFIAGLRARLNKMIDDQVVIDRDFVYLAQDFIHYPWEYGLRFTNRDEIKMINATLNIVLNYLVETYGLTLDRPALQQKFKELKHKARAEWGVE